MVTWNLPWSLPRRMTWEDNAVCGLDLNAGDDATSVELVAHSDVPTPSRSQLNRMRRKAAVFRQGARSAYCRPADEWTPDASGLVIALRDLLEEDRHACASMANLKAELQQIPTPRDDVSSKVSCCAEASMSAFLKMSEQAKLNVPHIRQMSLPPLALEDAPRDDTGAAVLSFTPMIRALATMLAEDSGRFGDWTFTKCAALESGELVAFILRVFCAEDSDDFGHFLAFIGEYVYGGVAVGLLQVAFRGYRHRFFEKHDELSQQFFQKLIACEVDLIEMMPLLNPGCRNWGAVFQDL